MVICLLFGWTQSYLLAHITLNDTQCNKIFAKKKTVREDPFHCIAIRICYSYIKWTQYGNVLYFTNKIFAGLQTTDICAMYEQFVLGTNICILTLLLFYEPLFTNCMCA